MLVTARFTAHSQTSWQIAGNSNITATKFLGTTNSQPLIMKTNNKENLRMLPNGNIGIGTKTPDNTLHVFKGSAGTVKANANAPLVVENSTDTYINLLAPNANQSAILFGSPLLAEDGAIVYNNPGNARG